ncbi:MAG: US12 family protein [Eubacterium sp.]|nr:US12 family protein [Eubacterium sp.]
MDFNNQSRNSNGALYESVMSNPARNQAQGNYGQGNYGQANYGQGNYSYTTVEEGSISRRTYNFIIGLIILWGVGVDTFICWYFKDTLVNTFSSNWVYILIYLGLVIGGMVIVNAAKSPALSFLGYNLIVVGFGITLAMVVEYYAPAVVTEAFLVTAIVTGLMLLLGTLWQEMFKKIGRILLVALIGVVITEAIMILITGTYPTWISVVSALLFSGFIGYDWAKAQEATATPKNAVLFATSLYVDIVNLFLNILRIVGNNK